MPVMTPLASPPPAPRGFTILRETDDFWIVDKRAGFAVHDGPGIPPQRTLLARLAEYGAALGIAPQLVHRLDRDTSGCLVVAKNDRAVEFFRQAFARGQIHKEYLALVKGVFHGDGTISRPLPGRRGENASALTHYVVERSFARAGVTLVRAVIETGRMHQIRLHFAATHHPVAGDEVHGDFPFNRSLRKGLGLKRQFLHARRIRFEYRGDRVEATAPLPPDLQEVLGRLAELEAGGGVPPG